MNSATKFLYVKTSSGKVVAEPAGVCQIPLEEKVGVAMG